MASKPGVLTEWPWTPLGRFKYIVLAPWALGGTYSFIMDSIKGEDKDLSHFLIFPLLLWRALHNQIWISLSRFRTAKAKNRILDKTIDFEQVDRESNWDDQIILNGILFYFGYNRLPGATHSPLWNTEGLILIIFLHAGPVEFLYYWLHRALHHHFLYSRYHSHHHSSIVTEPITSVIHPFAEHLMYFFLFQIPLVTTILTGTASIVGFAGYLTYIDFMNNMGHCNFEWVPSSLFTFFPFLKYIFYTPSYHSLHHTQFRTNYSLFMPIYDYIYGTMDKSTDLVYETAVKRPDEIPHVVHLTHLTTFDSVYHLRLGFSSLASTPYARTSTFSKMMKWLLLPVTYICALFFKWICSYTFVVERNVFDGKLKMQTWAVPRYSSQYKSASKRREVNRLIEEAILEAEKDGAKVISLGLLNQGEELNKNGEIYIEKHPNLKIRLVDGSSLAAALVVNSTMIPNGTKQVLMRGKLNKVAYSVAIALCERGIEVVTLEKEDYNKLKQILTKYNYNTSNLVLSRSDAHKVWLVGDGFKEEEQKNAPKGTIFVPFSQFPLTRKLRKDCVYYNTPAMIVPPALENMHSCENWLPRRVMSAWRIAGLVHALEGYDVHECGNSLLVDFDKVWRASLRHGFRPLAVPS